MKRIIKRGLAWVLVFVLLIPMTSSIGMIGISVGAAEVSYTYDGEYIYNWGTRGDVATYLSQNAEAFYEDNNTSYDVLSSYSGGTGQSDAPNSELYRELKALMTNAHKYINSYSAAKDLFKYTDCQNGGGKISSFYSGNQIGPSWDGGWNREHTWPNSKGLGGSDENDIMMLRPTSTRENSSRGNTAYGKSSGYYNPNSESGGKYDLRGDVARLFLYTYVRWGNKTYAWGKSGVMESVDVLLEWIEADPVDTWELGRNDSVESITGTRNVFVDYPELAFVLFGADIPEDLITPSGSGDADCGHNNFDSGVTVTATCIEKGYILYTCKTSGCGYSYKENVTAAKGHSYNAVVTAPTCTKGGYTTYTCSVCSNSYVGDNLPTAAHKYVNDVCTVCGGQKADASEVTISFADTSLRTSISKTQQVWSKDGVVITNNKAGASSDVAEYFNPVRFYSGSSITVEASDNITKIVFDCSSSSYASTLKESIGSSAKVSSDKVTVELSGSSDTFTVSKLSAQVRVDSVTVYCGAEEQSCQHTNVAIDGAVTPTCTATGLTEGKRCADCGEVIVAQTTVSALGHDWKAATTEAPKTCTRCGTTEGDKLPEDNTCQHNYTAFVTAPTCTKGGFTTYTCTLCSYSYEGNRVSAKGHNYSGGKCTVCGATDKVENKITISFADKNNRTEFDKNHQIWVQNGITVTNNKSKSTVDVADYADPARFYAASDVTISYAGITKIEINCQGLADRYIEGWMNAPAGATATNNNGIITVVFSAPVNSVTYVGLSAQCRAYDITVYASEEEKPCQHTNVATDGAVAPTCTATGLTEGKHCADCGEVIVVQTTVSALGHDWVDATYEAPKTCRRCGATEGEKLPAPTCQHTNVATDGAVAPTCTATGLTEGKHCADCGEVIVAQTTVSALGHDWIDATYEAPKTCIRCGATEGEKLPAPTCQHTNVATDKAVDPTCTATGLTEGKRCADCGEVIVAQTTVSALGHDWVDATYEAPKTCSRCGATEGEKLPAPTCQHTNVATDKAVDPTCTATGLTEGKRCADCGEVIVAQTTVSALGHDWVDATYEAPKTCTRCGATEGEKLPAKDPDDNENPDPDDNEVSEETPDKDHEQCKSEVSGWKRFWNAIANFFRSLFGKQRVCVCGESLKD